jgi:hypothetical protein
MAPPRSEKSKAEVGEFRLTLSDLSALRGAERLTSRDPQRPALQTVCMEPDGTLVSCDVHRLFVYRGSAIRPPARVLAHRSLIEVLKQRPYLAAAQLSLTGEEAVLRFMDERGDPPEHAHRAPLVSGEAYPRYERVIPSEWKIRALLPVRDLQAALDEAARFQAFLTSTALPDCHLEGNRVMLTFSQDSVLLQSAAARPEPWPTRWAMQVTLLATLDGLAANEEFAVALNRLYLRECLQAVSVSSDERVELSFNAPHRPIRIRPVDADHRFTLMMPMHLHTG